MNGSLYRDSHQLCSCAVPTADAVATGSLILVWLHSLTRFVETFDIQDTAGQCNDPSRVMMIHTLNTVLGVTKIGSAYTNNKIVYSVVDTII